MGKAEGYWGRYAERLWAGVPTSLARFEIVLAPDLILDAPWAIRTAINAVWIGAMILCLVSGVYLIWFAGPG